MRPECSGSTWETFASISNKKPIRNLIIYVYRMTADAPEAPGRLLLRFPIRNLIGNASRMLRKLPGDICFTF